MRNFSVNDGKDKDKTVFGFIGGLFLGIIALLIALCIYPDNSYERKTFANGWVVGFIFEVVLGVVIGLIVYFVTLNSINDAVNKYLQILLSGI